MMHHAIALLTLQNPLEWELSMNAFNRVFVIVALVALLVAGVVTLLSPAFTLSLLQNTANNIRNTFFLGFTDIGRVITRVTLAIGWAMIFGFLLWTQLRRSSSRTIEVARYTGGNAIRISTGAVAEKVQDAVNAVGGVIDAKVKATGRDRAVEIQLDVTATKDTDLVSKAEEIAITTRQVVQDQLGLKLSGKPQVSIRAKEGKPPKTKNVQRNTPALTEAPPAETIAPVAVPALPEAKDSSPSTQSPAPQP
jgi:hypothetical protein